MKKYIPALFVLIALFCLLPGCGKSKKIGTGAWDPDGQLVLNIGGEPSYLNPILARDVPSSEVIGMVFNGLLKVNSKLELVPDLAQRYTVSADGRVYTFFLRKDVKFHDGHPFSASDVIFTFSKILDPRTNTVRRSDFVIEGKPIQFRALDPYTIQAILPKPFAPFLVHMTTGILPSHILYNQDINTTRFNRQPLGTGPFIFDKWKSGDYVLLKRNPNYFGTKPKLAKIILRIIPDQNTALLALQKGEIDETNIQAKDVEKLEKHPLFRIYHFQTLQYNFLGFNLKKPLFSDSRVREAIAHAINKPAIVKGVLKGYGKVADLPSSPVSWAYPPDDQIKKFDFNPAKSRQLLKEAGLLWNGKLKRFEQKGKPVEFTMITNKGNAEREKVAQMMQQFLADVGIKMNIQVMEWSSFVKVLNDPKDPKAFDAIMLAWQLGIDPDALSVWHTQEYPKGFNLIGYSNPEVDTLLQQGREATSNASRKEVYASLFTKIAADSPYVFLYYPESVVGINKRVKGLSEPGPAGMMAEIEKVYVVK